MDTINRRYSTRNLENNFNIFLSKYNDKLINFKKNPDNIKMKNQFTDLKTIIENKIENFNQILKNITTEIKEKDEFLQQSSVILENKKILNKNLKKTLEQLKNTNAGAVGMYEDLKHLYNYTLIEYILIIIGIIGIIYNMKK